VNDIPAGSRVPKPYKKTYADKLPEWVTKFRQEGLSDAEINDVLKGKESRYINKWGNSSRVGVLINNYNNEYQKEQLVMAPRNQGQRLLSEQRSP